MPINFEDKVKKIQGAQSRAGGGNWIKGEGLFEVEVLSVKRMMGFNSTFTVRDKELFIAEFRILSSTHPDHKVGSTASWTCKDPSEGGAGDVKAFCIALTGHDPRSVKETDEKAQYQAALLALAAMGEDEAFKMLNIPEDFFVGKRVHLETKTTTTKALKPFTKHIWSPAKAGEEVQAA